MSAAHVILCAIFEGVLIGILVADLNPNGPGMIGMDIFGLIGFSTLLMYWSNDYITKAGAP